MADLVPPEDIEQIVGEPRDATMHTGRAVTAEQRVYILHSQACRDSGIDVRDCPFSVALDRGVDLSLWEKDVPVLLGVTDDGRLVDAPLARFRGVASDIDPQGR